MKVFVHILIVLGGATKVREWTAELHFLAHHLSVHIGMGRERMAHDPLLIAISLFLVARQYFLSHILLLAIISSLLLILSSTRRITDVIRMLVLLC